MSALITASFQGWRIYDDMSRDTDNTSTENFQLTSPHNENMLCIFYVCDNNTTMKFSCS